MLGQIALSMDNSDERYHRMLHIYDTLLDIVMAKADGGDKEAQRLLVDTFEKAGEHRFKEGYAKILGIGK